jgi:formylmethanofuran dehydrogenase subunit B
MPAAAGTAATRCTCTACPLLCDDISLSSAGADRACDVGRAAFAAALASPAATAATPAQNDAIARAAAILTAARRVLVTGLADATLEAIVAACDLAETLAAAVDAGQADLAAASGPTAARAGGVTADWEELRDRADLVIFWGCDPGPSHPRFVERFVSPPLADGRQRRTLAVGRAAVMPATPQHRHLRLDEERGVEAARCLQLVLAGADPPPSVDASLATACGTLAEAIRSANCVAFVTAAAGPVGLEGWSIAQLVRGIAHRVPAFELPLCGSGSNAAGAAAVCTWRYGAAGGIDRADRSGSRYLPGEATAERLVSRGEVDAVLAVGRLGDGLAAAVAAAGPQLSVVRIVSAGDPRQPGTADRTIDLRCADPLLTAGTLLRGDGRRVAVVPPCGSALPSRCDLIAAVHDAVARGLVPSAGGRP